MQTLRYSVNVRRTTPRKNGYSSVIFNVHYRNKIQRLFCGISVQNSDWNDKKERVKHGVQIKGIPYNELNERIKAEETFILDYFDECMYKHVEPSLAELKERFNGKFNSRDSKGGEEFYYYFEQFIETQAKSRNWKDSMKKKYYRIMSGLQKNHPNLKFSDLSTEMMQQILVGWSEGLDGKGTYNDHISKTLSCFRTFIKWAKGKNCIINEEFFSFNPKLCQANVEPRFLTVNELNQIRDLDIPESSTLSTIRDLFLFQCGTSLRYSDLKKLRKEDVFLDDNEEYCIRLFTEKNKKRVTAPLSELALGIYLKYKDMPYPDNLMFPVISNQKYNKHLKELGEEAGLEGEWVDQQWRLDKEIIIRHPKKDLGTHVARRTFISTAINAGVSPELIALVSSHADLKEMAPYIGLSQFGAKKVMTAIDEAYDTEIDD